MSVKLNKQILIFLGICLITTNLFAKNNYFDEGKKLYESKNYKKAKFKFEKDIVFNPKNENSYLYLAKIFNKEKEESLEEINLQTVILLNPENEEALYYLTLLRIKQSDFLKAKDQINILEKICKKLCSKKAELDEKLKNLLKQ